MAVGNSSGGVLFKEAAGDHAQESDGSNQNNGNDDSQCALGALAHALFGGFGRSNFRLVLAIFLFARCAHVVHSSHSW